MVDSGPGQLPEQVPFGVKAEEASFLHVFIPQCPSSSLSAYPQGGLHRSPLICPAGPPMAHPKSYPRSKSATLGSWPWFSSLPDDRTGLSSLVDGRPAGRRRPEQTHTQVARR